MKVCFLNKKYLITVQTCQTIIVKEYLLLKTRFLMDFFKIIGAQISICVRRVWVVIGFFLFEKQTFNGILKIIGIQNYLIPCNSPIHL